MYCSFSNPKVASKNGYHWIFILLRKGNNYLLSIVEVENEQILVTHVGLSKEVPSTTNFEV